MSRFYFCDGQIWVGHARENACALDGNTFNIRRFKRVRVEAHYYLLYKMKT